MRNLLTILLFITFALSGCKKEDSAAAQLIIDKEIIENYLAEKSLTAQSTSSGLYYIITKQGTGVKPTISSNVTVNYTGKLVDGTQFDSGTASFPLTNVIKGWQEGIPLFNAGGNGKLFIPSGLAYGSEGRPGIPANSVLIFDVYLISVQ